MSEHRSRLSFRHLGALAVVGASVLALASCHRVPLTAPSGSTITLVAATNVLPVNGSVDVTAVLVESGVTSSTGTTASTTGSTGTLVHDGTVVTFTTSLGTLSPVEAQTTNGQAVTRLTADGRSGTATVTAFSGAATKTLTVQIGAAGAARITVTANPQSLPGTGGTTTVTARVDDQQGNGLLGVPVSFSTTKGTLANTSGLTNDQGLASAALTTTQEATVTASAGGGTTGSLTGTVLVTLKPRTTVAITAPTSAIVAVPVSFTVTPGTGAIITNVVVDFGDGSSVPLGAITGATNVAHPFRSSGVLNVVATATDSEGGTGTASQQVSVAPLAVTLTATSLTPHVGDIVLFTAAPSAGALIDHYEWNFGDGSTGSTAGTQVPHSYLSTGPVLASVKAVASNGGASSPQLLQLTVQ